MPLIPMTGKKAKEGAGAQGCGLRRGTAAVFIRRGNALNRCGRPRQALDAYARALARDPRSRTAMRNRALTLWRLGRTDAAARSLRRVVDLAPCDGRARFALGILRYRQGRLRRAAVHLEKAAVLGPEKGRAWKRLAEALKLMGEAGRALEAYRRAAVCLPDQAEVFFGLAGTLNALGHRQQAIAALARVLELAPGHSSARHLRCALEGRTPSKAPAGYVRRLFDRYALRFDRQMCGPLAYKVPDRMARELAAARGRGRIYDRGLDLGCGTGLSGEALRPWTRHLTGVDISRGMLSAARCKGIYDRLVCQEILAFLQAGADTFDLAAAADVLIYSGDLAPLFAALRRRLASRGRCYLSTETTRRHPYRLRRSGRFAHHPKYISALAAETGFVVVRRRSLVIRKEHDRLVHGDFFILG